MFIKVASSPRSGIGMPSPILWSHPLKMQRIVLLSSILWWELGTNSLITGPGEWLSYRRFTSKLSWSWKLVLTLESNPSSSLSSIWKYEKLDPLRSVLSFSGTGTRLYINGLCVTAIEKVTNLQGFISLEEVKLLRLLKNTNFISVRNPYIPLLKWCILLTEFEVESNISHVHFENNLY